MSAFKTPEEISDDEEQLAFLETTKCDPMLLHIKLSLFEEDGHAADPVVFDEDGCHIAACMSDYVNDAGGAHGGVDVFVQPDVPPKVVALTLRKIANWAEDGLMDQAHLKKLTGWFNNSKRRSAK